MGQAYSSLYLWVAECDRTGSATSELQAPQSAARIVPPDITRLLRLSRTLSVFISSTALCVRVRFCRSKPWQIEFEICDESIGCAPSTRLKRRSVIKVSSLASMYVRSSASRYGRHATCRKKARQRCVSGQQVQHLNIKLTIYKKYYIQITNCVIKAG